MIDTGLQDRVVLVTGANHGIGAATARAFAAEGARVFVHYFRLPANLDPTAESPQAPGAELYAAERAEGADAVLAAIRDQGGQAEAGEFDLSDPASVPRLFDAVEAAFGPVEVLVNNAADWEADTFIPPGSAQVNELPELWQGETTATITARSHDRHFSVNSRATALLMAEFARRHIQRGATWGRIITVSTDAAHAHPSNISYAASKHAIESYSRSAAAEMGQYGITVNTVAPGPVQTGYLTPEQVSDIARGTPLGRVGEPADVADVITFLTSEQARWLTGQLLYVGGGWRMPQ